MRVSYGQYKLFLMPFALLAAFGLGVPCPSHAASTEVISLDYEGNRENSSSLDADMTPDGRFVVFDSWSTDLVPGVTNEPNTSPERVYVRDRERGVTQLVGVGSDSSISADARYVAFSSDDATLVPGDLNVSTDVFVFDRVTGSTERASVSSSGEQGLYGGYGATISANGRYVAFLSRSPNLVPDKTNSGADVFVHDLETRTTERVSVASDGSEATDGAVNGVTISADGRYVAFNSGAETLLPDLCWLCGFHEHTFIHDRETGVTEPTVLLDSGEPLSYMHGALSGDGRYIAFDGPGGMLGVYDRITGAVERVDVNTIGAAALGYSDSFSISFDGRFVLFRSEASNLVLDDTNSVDDLFLRDRALGITERVNLTNEGLEDDGYKAGKIARVSADGRFVVFYSLSTDLVPGYGSSSIFLRDRGEYTSSSRIPLTMLSDSSASLGAVVFSPVDGSYYGALSDLALGGLRQAVDFSLDPIRLLTSIRDVSGNGAPELAALAVTATGQLKLQVRDADTGAFVLNQAYFDEDWHPVDIGTVTDSGDDGAEYVAVLAQSSTTGEIAVQLRDGASGAFLKNVFFLNSNWQPRQLLVIDGFDGNAGSELGVLATNATGQIAVMIKDASTNAFIRNVFFLNANWELIHAVMVPDRNGNAAGELALLARNKNSGQVVAMIKDAATNTFLNNVFPFGAGWKPIKMVAMPDQNGNGMPELAVLALNLETGKPVIQIRDSMSGEFVRNLPALGSNWTPRDMLLVPDIGAGIAGLAVFGVRKLDALPVVQTVRSDSGALVSNVFLD